MEKRLLILENGKVFEGKRFGSGRECMAEIVFNTSMVGYQEIISDPSYCEQIVVMSYPVIGNYGLAAEDYESDKIHMSGFVVRDYNNKPSNFRSTKTLAEAMEASSVAGICDVDTREIVKIIRNEGSMRALITADEDIESGLNKLKSYIIPHNQVSQVTCKKAHIISGITPDNKIVVIDCGMKKHIAEQLVKHNSGVIILPFDSDISEIMSYKPNGLFISNGPGNPEDVPQVIELVRKLKGKMPIFGICLGHQIIALACGGKTYKMKFGHRGANHPVKNLLTGKIEITSQNHSYEVDKDSLDGTGLEITHVNLIDGGVEGFRDVKNKIIGLQYHPESSAGPEDSEYLFNVFHDNLVK